MKNQLPTFEEFRSETKKKLKASLSNLNDKKLMKSENHMNETKESLKMAR